MKLQGSLRVLIAEDDEAQCHALKEWVGLLRPQWHIVATAVDVGQVMRAIDDLAPDLLILDIHLGGTAGDNWIKSLPLDAPIVFVTGDPNFALDAFDLQAVDYVLKPVTMRRLKSALDRAATDARLTHRHLGSSPLPGSGSGAVSASGASLDGEASSPDDGAIHWLNISRGSEVVMAPVSEVVYLQADLKYTRVVSLRGDGLVRLGISELCQRITSPGFVRIHRSIVVNLNFVTSVRRNDVGQMDVHLSGRSEVLRVSKTFQHVFRMT